MNVQNIRERLKAAGQTAQEAESGVSHFEMVPAAYIHMAENNPYALEDDEESLRTLAADIEANGLIHPCSVNKRGAADYVLISGQRRFKALTTVLNRKSIPCMVCDHLTDDEAQLRLHMANLSVREYTTEQKLRFYKELEQLLTRMKESGSYKGGVLTGIAQLLNISTRQVSKYKRIVEALTEEEQQQIVDGNLTVEAGYKAALEKCAIPSPELPPPLELNPEPPPPSFPQEFERETENSEEETVRPSGFQNNFLSELNGSAPSSSSPPDERQTMEPDADSVQPWQECLEKAISQLYDIKELYAFYIFQVPTPKQAISEKLKDAYKSGTIDGLVYERRNNHLELWQGDSGRTVLYQEVDECIRTLIREHRLLAPEEERDVLLLALKGSPCKNRRQAGP